MYGEQTFHKKVPRLLVLCKDDSVLPHPVQQDHAGVCELKIEAQ